jgi:hypothetical protein
MKTCCTCKQKKADTEFSKCHSHLDGLASICKACSSVYRKEWAKHHVEYLRAAKKADYARNKERYNALAQERRRQNPDSRRQETVKRTQQHRYELAEYCKVYRKQNPEKYRAHQAVHIALRNGTLTKPDTCEQCGSSRSLRAHHNNYDEPLSVRWLCESCHKEVHKKEVSHEAVV